MPFGGVRSLMYESIPKQTLNIFVNIDPLTFKMHIHYYTYWVSYSTLYSATKSIVDIRAKVSLCYIEVNIACINNNTGQTSQPFEKQVSSFSIVVQQKRRPT